MDKKGKILTSLAVTGGALLVFLLLRKKAGARPPPPSVEVSCADFSDQKNVTRQVEVAVGDTLTVTLCSNPSTGASWQELAQARDQTIVQQTDQEYVVPEAPWLPGLFPELFIVGAPGTEVWTFKALKKGTSTIYMLYGRPWEGAEKGEWSFRLTVVVK